MAERRRFSWKSLRGITIWGIYIDLLLAFLFFALIALLVNWKFALIIMGVLLFHESGHAWGMKRYGIPIKGFYFLPLAGLVVVSTENCKTRCAETDIAILGPVWGLVSVIVIWIIWRLTGSQIAAGIACIASFINLLNLIPINPLDGGRIIKSLGWSITPGIGLLIQVLGVIGAIVILSKLNIILAMLVVLFGISDVLTELRQYRRSKDRKSVMKKMADFLTDALSRMIPRTPEAIAEGLKIYHEMINRMTPEIEAEMEALSKERAPEIASVLKKTEMSHKDFCHLIPLSIAISARQRWWESWKKTEGVEEHEVACHHWPAQNWPLIDFLKEDMMSPMTFREGSWRFLAYLALLNVLIYFYVATSKVCNLFQLIDLL